MDASSAVRLGADGREGPLWSGLVIQASMASQTRGENVARLKLMVDRALDDGRFVVVNDSREDAPVGTTFVEMTVKASELVQGEFKSSQIGAAMPVALRLEAVESWRRSLGAVPFGHSAAIQLSGPGLKELGDWLAGKSKDQYVFLATVGQ